MTICIEYALQGCIFDEKNLSFCNFKTTFKLKKYLGRPHDELLLFSGDHLRVFVPHDGEHALQKLLVRVVAIVGHPRITFDWKAKQKLKCIALKQRFNEAKLSKTTFKKVAFDWKMKQI